jgi:hypothetical protein
MDSLRVLQYILPRTAPAPTPEPAPQRKMITITPEEAHASYLEAFTRHFDRSLRAIMHDPDFIVDKEEATLIAITCSYTLQLIAGPSQYPNLGANELRRWSYSPSPTMDRSQ